MKKIVLMVLLSTISFYSLSSTLEDEAKSGNSKAAYQLAEIYEKQNDLKNALHWYKESAKLSLQMNDKLVIAENSTHNQTNQTETPNNKQKINITQEQSTAQSNSQIISDRVVMHQDYQAQNGVFNLLDTSFGLRPYHSNYILPITYDSQSHKDGRKHVETTFQISFKKDVFNDVFGLDETIGFAYTQRNWWQTSQESSPFRETNYLPELYVQLPNKNTSSALKGTQFGFLHESNGQGNEAGKSRSWNRLYLEGYLKYQDSYIVPRVWYRIPEDKAHDDNRDIEDYLGYGDLTIFVPYKKSLFKVLIRNNLSFHDNRGALQIDWTYPLWDTGLFGYVQYFNGYGESLIDYNKTTNRLGIGIALSR
ncbi:phospholipase A [Orbus mooreae]|uniref:phospholipase A n=1 Tax=Orbus mooreae TaxID=3074107 RepID=UPI00370DDD89